MSGTQGAVERKSSFYLPFLLLGAKRRNALIQLYHFCRVADDLSDEPGTPGQKRRRFAAFRCDLDACLSGNPKGGFWIDFKQTIDAYAIPHQALLDTLRGVEMDLEAVRLQTFHDLLDYAHLVAGGPGRAAMAIFGGRGPRHEKYAEHLGAFLQITNVVRDILEDRELDRLYLPEHDLKRFGVDPDHPVCGPEWDAFVRFELGRALDAWKSAKKCLDTRERSRLLAAEGMAAVYTHLHQRLMCNPSLALKGRVSLPLFVKITATLGSALRCLWWRFKPASDCGCCL
jgi:phytoene synthase